MQKQPTTAIPAPKYTVEPISGDGYCMFGSIEKAMGWNRGDAKRRIIQFILSKTGPTNEDLVVTLADVVGVDKVDPNSIRNAYISQLVEDRYHGGEAEASLLSREQNGRLRIVLIRTSGIETHRTYQKEGVIPMEEVILYHSKCGSPADHPTPDHFDLVCEQTTDNSIRYIWHLTPEEAAATTDSKLSRWVHARVACFEWKHHQEKAKGTESNRAPAIAPAAATTFIQPVATIANSIASSTTKKTVPPAIESLQLPSSYAGAARLGAGRTDNTPTHIREAESSSTSMEGAKWGLVADPRKRKDYRSIKSSVSPRLVIMNFEPGTTESQLRTEAEKRQIDLHEVVKVEFLPNGKAGLTCRAVLHMRMDSQAKLLLKHVKSMTQGKNSKWTWDMREYEPYGTRGSINTAAPKAMELGKQLISPPYPPGVYNLCTLSESMETCRRKNCKFYHRAGAHVTGVIPSAAERKAAQSE